MAILRSVVVRGQRFLEGVFKILDYKLAVRYLVSVGSVVNVCVGGERTPRTLI